MITKDLLKRGYQQGIVRIVDSPNGDGAVCEIGEYWFYFGGQMAEEMSAEQYVKNIPEDTIIDEILGILEEFSLRYEFEDEYAYYEAYLTEKLKIEAKNNMLLWDILKKHIGHSVEIVSYGDDEDICLECTDCNEVILDAGIYTICARND